METVVSFLVSVSYLWVVSLDSCVSSSDLASSKAKFFCLNCFLEYIALGKGAVYHCWMNFRGVSRWYLGFPETI